MMRRARWLLEVDLTIVLGDDGYLAPRPSSTWDMWTPQHCEGLRGNTDSLAVQCVGWFSIHEYRVPLYLELSYSATS